MYRYSCIAMRASDVSHPTVRNCWLAGSDAPLREALGARKIMTAVHKHYTPEEWKAFADANKELLPCALAATLQLESIEQEKEGEPKSHVRFKIRRQFRDWSRSEIRGRVQGQRRSGRREAPEDPRQRAGGEDHLPRRRERARRESSSDARTSASRFDGNSAIGHDPRYVAVSTGSGAADVAKLAKILANAPAVKTICLDVANGSAQRARRAPLDYFHGYRIEYSEIMRLRSDG